MPNGATYLLLMGYGLGAMYGQAIRRVQQVVCAQRNSAWQQAMWILEVENFGPLIVDCDHQGNSLFEKLNKQIDERLAAAYEGLPRADAEAPWRGDAHEDEVLS